MTKIAFVIDTIESPTAGTEKQLLMLIKQLDRSKFEPHLCVLRGSEWLKNHFSDCAVIDIGVKSFAHLSSYQNIFRFASFLKRGKFDIVQTHFVEGNKVGIISATLAGVRTIVSTRRNQGYWHNRLEMLMLRGLNKRVSCFLANSESTRQWAMVTEWIAPSQIHVIHNSLEIERYSKMSSEKRSLFRKELGFSPDALLVGVVANLRPVKALDVFVRAAKLVSVQCLTARFIVVGAGPERQRLEQLAADLGISSLIRFLGKRLDIPEILGCLDMGVLSSRSESFSNSIVEYMAAGLPVVCTNVGGAREAVENGLNGYVVDVADYVNMADRISTVLTSGDMVLLGQNGRNKAESLFSLTSIMKKYEEFYGALV